MDEKIRLNESSASAMADQSAQSLHLKYLAIMSWVGTVFFAGTIYGFASLQLMLEGEGALHEQCGGESPKACADQLSDFALMFSIGSSLQTFSSLVVGYGIDVYGPRYCLTLAGCMMSAGILLFASADLNSLWQYVAAISLTAVAANIVYLSSFTVSFVVDPSFMSTYNTVNSCLFDTSSVIFFLFYLINLHLGYTFEQIFVAYFGLAVLIFIGLCYCWYLVEPILIEKKRKLQLEQEAHLISRTPTPTASPIMNNFGGGQANSGGTPERKGYEAIINSSERGAQKSRSLSAGDEVMELEGGTGGATAAIISTPKLVVKKDGNGGILVAGEAVINVEDMHSIPWYDQLRSPQFMAITIYAGLHLLRACSYMGNMENFLNSLGDESTDHFYTSVFSVVVPLGFLVIPLVDYVMFSNTFINSLNMVTQLGIAFGVVTCINVLPVQVVGFFIFCVFRALLYSVIGTFVAHTFGPLNGGRTNGVLWLLASILNFALYPLSSFILENCGGDWTLLNVILLLCCMPAYTVITCGLGPSLTLIKGADRPNRE